VKIAFLLLNGCDLESAKQLLNDTDGQLEPALRHLAAAQSPKA
jgi:hypothetical protein